MFDATTWLARLLTVSSLALGFMSGLAHAAPVLSISGGTQETIGDPGGTLLANPAGSLAGRGLPTVNGGWAAGAPGFGPDPTFGNAVGITGFKPSAQGAPLTLSLSEAARVTFTFYGRGDSVLANQFQVNTGGGFQTLFTGGATGQDAQVTFDLPAGSLPFRFVTGNDPGTPGAPFTLTNGLSVDLTGSAGFFLGADPYLAFGQFSLSGTAVFVGLTDRPGSADHDFQDLGVRITAVSLAVAEPPAPLVALVVVGGLAAARAARRLVRPGAPSARPAHA